MENKHVCKKCQRELSKESKKDLCEHCQNERVGLLQKVAAGVVGVVGLALTVFVNKSKK
mgnify:FL=1